MDDVSKKPARKSANRFRVDKRGRITWVLEQKFTRFRHLQRELDKMELNLRKKHKELEKAYIAIKRG